MNNTNPGIVLGTMGFGTQVDPDTSFALLDSFVAGGGDWLDTANCYSFWADPSGVGGASERVIGAWLRARPGARDSVRIATKVRQNPLVPHVWPESAEGLSARAVHAGMEESLERLGVDHVDMLWAHAEDRTVPLEETVGAFGELVAKGTALRVGAANHTAWRVERARSLAREQGAEPWTALQLRHSLVQPRPLTPLAEGGHRHLTPDDLDLAASEGLDVWAYSSLLWGSYTRPDKPFQDIYDHPGTTRVLAVLDDIADEVSATRNQVVLAWLLHQGIAPIVGVSRVQHVEEALAARDVRLTGEQLARFEAAR
ncbi:MULTISPECIES: aldo/keto reductase [unclassified Streptomyces]|uniref:aldo/keto reductase n=1 Tax=unclassified Streptomyces TaxID=2593676 RepID=UPI002ED446B3|nr:aldo/keto reductase [Streptomyces sp. NBC_00891]WSY03734.1 aldo/keto reductase [Streptomyces sp. NBC_00890]WSZ05360.1 aldo/keto reductase [Streptomyces sp. NBC_00869]WSZ27144.1 aldo/keto reductase [Streptomyces sp. NBC_00870]